MKELFTTALGAFDLELLEEKGGNWVQAKFTRSNSVHPEFIGEDGERVIPMEYLRVDPLLCTGCCYTRRTQTKRGDPYLIISYFMVLLGTCWVMRCSEWSLNCVSRATFESSSRVCSANSSSRRTEMASSPKDKLRRNK